MSDVDQAKGGATQDPTNVGEHRPEGVEPEGVKPKPEGAKPKRKPRTLTEEQKKVMLENLRKGREKAHTMRREMEAKRKKDATPKSPTKSPPKSPPPKSPRKSKSKQRVIYEMSDSDSTVSPVVVVRKKKKVKSPKRRVQSPPSPSPSPPPSPPQLKRTAAYNLIFGC